MFMAIIGYMKVIIAFGFAFHSSFPGGPTAPLAASFREEPSRKCWAQVGGWRHFATHQNSLRAANATADSLQLLSTGNEAKSKLRPLCLSALRVKSEGRPSGKNNHLDKPSTNMLINSQSSCYCLMLIVFPRVSTIKNSLRFFGNKMAIAF